MCFGRGWGGGAAEKLAAQRIMGHMLSPKSWEASLRSTDIITQGSPKEQTCSLLLQRIPKAWVSRSSWLQEPLPQGIENWDTHSLSRGSFISKSKVEAGGGVGEGTEKRGRRRERSRTAGLPPAGKRQPVQRVCLGWED